MASQCLVIAAIILVIAFGFMRSKRSKWAISTLPLAVLPFINGVFEKIYGLVADFPFGFMAAAVEILVSVIASCIGVGVCSIILINGKKNRIPYISVSVLFNLILAVILMNHYYTLYVG